MPVKSLSNDHARPFTNILVLIRSQMLAQGKPLNSADCHAPRYTKYWKKKPL